MKKISNFENFCNEESNIKKTLLGSILGLSLLSTPATSQITQRKLDKSYLPVPDLGLTAEYDSTSNKVEDLRMLKGEMLYFRKGTNSNLYGIGFTGFYKPLDDYRREVQLKHNITLGEETHVPLKTPDGVDIKKFSELKLHQTTGDVELLRGEYFQVMDVFYKQYPYTNSYSIVYYLKLKRISNNEVLYFLSNMQRWDDERKESEDEFSRRFPFIVVGFYDKIKKFFLDSTIFLFTKGHYSILTILPKGNTSSAVSSFKAGTDFSIDPFYFDDDFKLTKNYKLPDSSIWTCKDLLIDENDNLLKILLEESSGIQIAIPVEEIFKGLLSADNQKLKELLK